MQYTKPRETLPTLVEVSKERLPMIIGPTDGPVVMKLIAIIPPKVSGPKGPVDPEALGKNLDVFA